MRWWVVCFSSSFPGQVKVWARSTWPGPPRRIKADCNQNLILYKDDDDILFQKFSQTTKGCRAASGFARLHSCCCCPSSFFFLVFLRQESAVKQFTKKKRRTIRFHQHDDQSNSQVNKSWLTWISDDDDAPRRGQGILLDDNSHLGDYITPEKGMLRFIHLHFQTLPGDVALKMAPIDSAQVCHLHVLIVRTRFCFHRGFFFCILAEKKI